MILLRIKKLLNMQILGNENQDLPKENQIICKKWEILNSKSIRKMPKILIKFWTFLINNENPLGKWDFRILKFSDENQ